MKTNRIVKLLYLLSFISVFLPWFTHNAQVMGYCWGYYFLKWLIVPLGVIGYYLFGRKRSPLLLLLSEIGMLCNPAVLVIAFGRWQEVCNINSGFHWEDGFRTALPTYWISLILFLIFFSVFQIDLMAAAMRKRKR